MVQIGKLNFTSFTEAGINPPPPVELHFLPLLKPENQVKPPIERLQNGSLTPDRIVFTTTSSSEKITWTSSNHIFPAAFPRSHFHATHLPGPEQIKPHKELIEIENNSKNNEKELKKNKQIEREIRNKDVELFSEQLSSLCLPETVYPPHSKEEAERFAKTLKDSGQPQLWNCIQRIIPKRNDGDGDRKGKKPITLFLTHANGFHKEIHEPMLETLLNKLESKESNIYVEEIWNMDTFNAGDSGVLNRDSLSVCTPWWDHARDIKQFLESYLPPLSRNGEKPELLLKEQNLGSGKNGRTLISISHSHSGAASSMVFMTHPNLCDGHIAIDPMMFRFEDFSMASIPAEQNLARGAMMRKDVFKNRESVRKYLDSKEFFTSWDKRVRELHIRFGFCPFPGYEQKGDPPVVLCSSKWSEASNFGHSWSGAWGTLETTRPHKDFKGFCHLIWTDYGRSLLPLQLSRDQIAENFEKFGDRFTWSDWDTNHLAFQEKPDYSADKIAEVIFHHMKTFKPSQQQSKL